VSAACPHPPELAETLFLARDYVTGDPFTVGRCGRCRLAVTLPAPAPERLARYYPDAYYGEAGARRFPHAVEWLQGLLYAGRARTVERLAGGRPGRVLDVGCGRGRLLEAFRRRGWEVQGTELSEASAARPRAAGIPVHVGPLESAPWVDGSFDAVTMWHVLEHWPDPALPLAHAARLLRPGGVLYVGVPNFASTEARAARGAFFHLDVPRHLVHLAPADLARLLAAQGLSTRRWSFFAPEYDLFSLVQSAENALGLPYNLLYGLLREKGARLVAGTAFARLAALLLAVPLGLAALPASLLLAATGRGATVATLAVKGE
jgi:SAM-dependent methyltransferase